MLCSVFILLAFAGWSYGLQAPLYYQYKYYGSVSNGIPELSSQASGWAMKADINVFVLKNDGEAVFQIQNVKMADFASNLKCDSRGDLPDDLFLDTYPSLKSAFEAPFKAHLFQSEDYAIEYSEDKFPWLINVRKGIVSIFRNEILHGNIETQIENSISDSLHKAHVINTFKVMEETIFGKCSVYYTLHPVPEYMTGTRNRYLEELYEQDVQRKAPESSAYTSKTSKKTSSKKEPRKSAKAPSKYQRSEVPEIKDDLWHVIRSVDFDHCEEYVGLQANIFDAVPMHGGQHDWRRSRSSVSEYIFRGSPGHFRLERALVEGARTMAPLGVKTELLQSRINQTLQLMSVETLQAAPSLEGNIKHSKTWMFEFWSPNPIPKESKVYPWVVYTGEGENFMTSQIYGLNPPAEHKRNLHGRNVLVNVINSVLSLIEINDHEGPFPLFSNVGEQIWRLRRAASLMKDLSKEEIMELFTLIDSQDWTDMKKNNFLEKSPIFNEHGEQLYRKLLIGVAASSGLNYAHEAILDLAKVGKIDRFDLMTFFMTLTSNARGPQLISPLMDYVIAIDKEEKFFTLSTPNIIINFANFLNKMCLSPQAKAQYYYGPLYGDEKCPVHLIGDKFVPFLENIIYSDNATYRTDAAVMALRYLGGAYSYKILSAIIREEAAKFPISTRVYAIESLDGRFYLSNNLREVAINLLTETLTKVGEDLSIREAALNMIIMWGPDNHFFYRMARMSWREPSRQFASLLTTMLDTLAKAALPGFELYAQVASHALKLARPVAPSFKYSYINTLISNLVDKRIASMLAVQWQTSDKSSRIKNLYLGSFNYLGGFEGNQFEADMETESLINLIEQNKFTRSRAKEGSMEGTFVKAAQEFYDNVETYLKTKLINVDEDRLMSADLSLSILQHMKLFISRNMISEHSKELYPFNKKNISFVQYISPINVQSVDPTELGIPLFMEIIAPIVSSLVGEVEIETNEFQELEHSKFDVFLRLIAECHGSIEVLLPWSRRIARVESSSVKDINLPINANIRHIENPSKENPNKIVFHSPSVKVPLLRAASFPTSSLVSMHPMMENGPEKLLNLRPGSPPKKKVVQIQKYFTGFNLSLSWKSNLEFPYTKYKLEKMLNDPISLLEAPFMPLSFITSTLQFWEFSVDFDPTSSSTQTTNIFFTKGTFGGDKPESFTQERGDFSQYGQEGLGQYDQEQESIQQGFEDGFQDLKESSIDNYRLSFEDSENQRLEKLQNSYGGSGGFKGIKVAFNGSEYRSFEILFVSSKEKSEARRLKKSGLIFIRSPLPGLEKNPSLICLNYESSSPSYRKLFNLRNFETDNSLKKNTKLALTLECTGKPILALEGVYKLAEPWISKLQEDVPKYCDYDQFTDMFTLHSHAVYNEVQFDFDWERVCDHKYPITSKAVQLLENTADKFLSYRCQNSNENHRTHIEFDRCPVTENWDIKIQHDDLENSFKNIPHNHIFNHLFALGKKTSLELHPDIHSLFNWESDRCVFGVDSVRTFDGYFYEYKPTQCWSVAARSCKENAYMKMLFLVRSPDTESTIPDVKYIDVSRGVVVEYVRNNIIVNGKIINPVDGKEVLKDKDGLTLVTIIKKDDYVMVKPSEKFYFSIKNKVTVHADLPGTLCGLCGNFNGEPEDDLIGPHGCSYSDIDSFVASWTGKSDKCDLYTLLELREGADNYRKQCTTIEEEYRLASKFKHECYYSSREVKELDGQTCVTKNYNLRCAANCDALGQLNKNETFDCWSSEHVPSSVLPEADQEKSFVYFDLPEEHQHTISHHVQSPTLCLPMR